jgi:hypothetical protein
MTTDIIRLHISPLTPTLLDSILAPSVRPLATDVSFHTIQTFPENSYGYVSLPTMEAEKLKKKLNGSILKGKKLKVEVARPAPEKTKHAEGTASDTETTPRKKSKKRKAEDGVLEGYELPSDRKVKRGWTEPASARKDKRLRKAEKKSEKDSKKPKTQAKSKYTENAECLFRTKTPPNKTAAESASKKEKKSKKNKSPHEVLVHEFERTMTHPTFIKSEAEGKKVSLEFVKGKGWVDEEGNVKDPVTDKVTKPINQPGKKDGAKERVPLKTQLSKKRKKSPVPEESSADESKDDSEPDWTSSSGSSSSESEGEEKDEDVTSSDTSSSDESNKNSAELSKKASSTRLENTEAATDESDSSPVEASGEARTPAEKNQVHPLEALFKRPASSEKNKPSLDVNTNFSFFGANDEEDEEEEDSSIPVEPLTPFTRKDLQVRGIRSAAPTPDTALPHRTTFFNQASDEDIEDVDDDDENDTSHHYPETTPSKTRSESDSRQPEQSEFAKWFWEHRGDNNRAWKRRRREAAKEKRQQENRRKGMKGRS